jgi:putative restriction endonuclease
LDKKITFGSIPGITGGTVFSTSAEMNEAGLHRSTMGGISGRGGVGADSKVLRGGYKDDID